MGLWLAGGRGIVECRALLGGWGRACRSWRGLGVVLFCWFGWVAGEGEAHGWVAGWKGRERDGGG